MQKDEALQRIRSGVWHVDDLATQIKRDRQLKSEVEKFVRESEQPWTHVPQRKGNALAAPADDRGTDALVVPVGRGFKITGKQNEGLFRIQKPYALAMSFLALTEPTGSKSGEDED